MHGVRTERRGTARRGARARGTLRRDEGDERLEVLEDAEQVLGRAAELREAHGVSTAGISST